MAWVKALTTGSSVPPVVVDFVNGVYNGTGSTGFGVYSGTGSNVFGSVYSGTTTTSGLPPATMALRLCAAVQKVLTPDLLKPAYRFMYDPANPTAGHCYHAAEALWHLLGGRASGWAPQVYREDDGVTHWWLRHRDGSILDPTAAQYGVELPPYDRGLGKGCGFLTKQPSRRAAEIIRRVRKLGVPLP